jgi:abortive infection bacteriophage resistance protein
MKYQKQALTFEEQADCLIQRGLIADRILLIRRLEAVNYYRLSGYLHPFRQTPQAQIVSTNATAETSTELQDTYVPGTTLDIIWDRYTFDRRLRLLIMDAIERIEVAVRTRIVYEFAHRFGSFGHLEPANLPNLKIDDYLRWRAKLASNTGRSEEAFAKHFSEKYGDQHSELPLWMLCELMDFGGMQTLYRGLESALKQTVAREFRMGDELLFSWLRAFEYGP